MSNIELTQRSNNFLEEQDHEHSQFIKFSKEKPKTPQKEFEDKVEAAKSWLDYIKNKVESALWVLGAAGTIYYSNFFHVFFYHEQINILFSNIFLFCVALNVVFGLYAAFVMPYILKIDKPIDEYQPKIVYIGAASGFIGFITLVIAIWPAFGWYSPPMVFVMFLGYLNTSAFLPSNGLGSVLFGLIFIGAFYSHYFIPHNGHLHTL
ncbi:hypothetical protein ABPG72_001737 [Tetrahymena utriculariae]